MTEKDPATAASGISASRRGIFALAAAAAALVGFRSRPAQANVIASVTGAGTSQVGLAATFSNLAPLIPAIGTTTHCVIGSATAEPVIDLESGVLGVRAGGSRVGVYGINSINGFGVVGKADSGIGVVGKSDNGTGMQGNSNSGVGVNGISSSSQGVLGQSSSLEGVRGESPTSAGVHGISTSGIGVRGQSTSSNGMLAVNSGSNIPALRAVNNSAGTRVAAVFTGNVRVEGSFAVTGAKAAAVPMADGSLATVYCQESPEPWFEDFGRGTLRDGAARIEIEPEFASIVRLDSYMVFLTPEGDGEGLYVHARDDSGFEVRERKGGRGAFSFSYRLVARRKDIAGERLVRLDPIEDVEIPVNVAFTDSRPPLAVSGSVEG